MPLRSMLKFRIIVLNLTASVKTILTAGGARNAVLTESLTNSTDSLVPHGDVPKRDTPSNNANLTYIFIIYYNMERWYLGERPQSRASPNGLFRAMAVFPEGKNLSLI